jgi:phosphoribosylformylglycinamidine (FGAM) synthase PurS component
MYKIEVFMKEQFKDGKADSFLDDLKTAGIDGISKARFAALYFLDGEISAEDIKRAAEELFADKITQDFLISTTDGENTEEKDKEISIEIRYKKGVTDNAAQSALKALADLNISGNISVKTGRKYYMSGGISKETAEFIAYKILANALIEECRIKF